MSNVVPSPRKRRRPLIGDDDSEDDEKIGGPQSPATSLSTRSRVATRSPSMDPVASGSRVTRRAAGASASPLGSPVRTLGNISSTAGALTRKSQRVLRGSGSPSESPSNSRATSPTDTTRPVRMIRQTARATARTAAVNAAAEAAASTRQKNGRGMDVDSEAPNAAKEEAEKKEDEERRQRWREEFFEIVEQLPLELHRSFSLMRELEAQMLERLMALQRETDSYRDARRQLQSWTESRGHDSSSSELPDTAANEVQASSDKLADSTLKEEDAGVPPPTDSATVTTGASATPPSRSARMAILGSVLAASSDVIRAAEEKSGLAATAYDWVDRHIRRLDGDLQRFENALLLGLRVGTEESRGLKEALGTGAAGATIEEKRERLAALGGGGNNAAGVGRGKHLRLTLTGAPPGKTAGGLSSAGFKSSASPMLALPLSGDGTQRARRPPPKKRNAKPSGAQGLDFMQDMPVEENEPKYCYCDQVSFGDMIACDNEFCPREWYHYSCIGMTAPPKGRWFCQFCAPSGWRGSGMAVPANAVAKPPGWKR